MTKRLFRLENVFVTDRIAKPRYSRSIAVRICLRPSWRRALHVALVRYLHEVTYVRLSIT